MPSYVLGFNWLKKGNCYFLLSCIVQLLSVSQHTDGYGSIHELLMTLQSSKAYYGKIVTFFFAVFYTFFQHVLTAHEKHLTAGAFFLNQCYDHP